MGTSIKLSMGGVYESPHDYGDCHIQGGTKGVVFGGSPDQPNYRTAFVEVFPPNSFIRGEGSTVQEADEECWRKFQAHSTCSHDFEPRDYTNGGGICKHCKQFGSRVFTGSDLGQFCDDCGAETLEGFIQGSSKWYCSLHYPLNEYMKLFNKITFADDIYLKDGSDEIDYGNYRLDSEFGQQMIKLRDITYQRQVADPAILRYFEQFTIS